MSSHAPNNPMDTAAPREFRTTHWSLIAEVGNSDPQRVEQALDELCRTYWAPLYAYAVRQDLTPHDAQDLIQEFLKSLLERNDFARVNREKGRFRTFLLASLRHFLLNEIRARKAKVRGGGFVHVPLPAPGEPVPDDPALATDPQAERAFDQQWATAVMARALQRLTDEFQRKGQQRLFEAIQGYLVDREGDQKGYAAAARALGMQTGTLGTAICRMRQQYREMVRQEVARTVPSTEEVEDEIRYLLSVWDGGGQPVAEGQ